MSFDEMKDEDFAWIRWDRMRWDFVNLLLAVAEEHVDRPRAIPCKLHESCVAIEKSFPLFGMEIYEDDDGQFRRIDHREDLKSLVTSAMRDGMMMVSHYIEWGSGHPLRGHSEVPFEVGRIVHSPYFTNLHPDDGFAFHVKDEPADEIRELLYSFVHLAFPDEFLVEVHRGVNSENSKKLLTSWGANAEFTRQFESNFYVAPVLSKSIIESLKIDLETSREGTEHFWMNRPGPWQFGAGYSLDAGFGEASLDSYWHDLESIPDAFEYSEHGNMAGVGMGFLARSPGLFVSQQVWVGGAGEEWNTCTESFNKNLAPIMEYAGSSGAAMIIFSSYRNDAYIVSSVPASWDEYAPLSAVLGPLPEAFGIVGVWTNYDEARYTPRAFDEIINADWSEQITASARYLRDCLTAIEAAKH